MSAHHPARVQPGVPTGGQYSVGSRTEASITLDTETQEDSRRRALPWYDPEALPRFEGSVEHCRHPDCSQTNWGGSDRVHRREVDCPPLKVAPPVIPPPIRSPADVSPAGAALLRDLEPLGLRGTLTEEPGGTPGWTRLEITSGEDTISILAHYETREGHAVPTAVVIRCDSEHQGAQEAHSTSLMPQEIRCGVRCAVVSSAMSKAAEGVFGDDVEWTGVDIVRPAWRRRDDPEWRTIPAIRLRTPSGGDVMYSVAENGELEILVDGTEQASPYVRELVCRDTATKYGLPDSDGPVSAVSSWLTRTHAAAMAGDLHRGFFG